MLAPDRVVDPKAKDKTGVLCDKWAHGAHGFAMNKRLNLRSVGASSCRERRRDARPKANEKVPSRDKV